MSGSEAAKNFVPSRLCAFASPLCLVPGQHQRLFQLLLFRKQGIVDHHGVVGFFQGAVGSGGIDVIALEKVFINVVPFGVDAFGGQFEVATAGAMNLSAEHAMDGVWTNFRKKGKDYGDITCQFCSNCCILVSNVSTREIKYSINPLPISWF